MGKKINPIYFRLGIKTKYHSLWYSNKNNYNIYLKKDILIREILRKCILFNNLNYIDIIISNILKINFYITNIYYIKEFENFSDVFIYEISKIFKKNLILNFVYENLFSAKSISIYIVNSILNKISIKKIIKREILKCNFLGLKIQISGRIDGVDIARKEWNMVGKIPLHNIKSNIDYYYCEAVTQYGVLCIKTWIFNN